MEVAEPKKCDSVLLFLGIKLWLILIYNAKEKKTLFNFSYFKWIFPKSRRNSVFEYDFLNIRDIILAGDDNIMLLS